MVLAASRAALGLDSAASTMAGRCRYSSPAEPEFGAPDSQKATLETGQSRAVRHSSGIVAYHFADNNGLRGIALWQRHGRWGTSVASIGRRTYGTSQYVVDTQKIRIAGILLLFFLIWLINRFMVGGSVTGSGRMRRRAEAQCKSR